MSGETDEARSSWTTDTLHAHVQKQLDDMRRLLDERYNTQTKAVDAAFASQQTAMQTALTAAERAVATALLSAEKAVTKAENAAEKRFESVNEFRGQLTDQAATFLSRSEADVRLQALADRIETEVRIQSERSESINKRLAEMGGSEAAVRRMIGYGLGALGLILTFVVFVANYFFRR